MAVIQSRAEVPTSWEQAVASCEESSVESLSKLGRNEAQTLVYRAAMAKVGRPARRQALHRGAGDRWRAAGAV